MELTTTHRDYQRLDNLIAGDEKWVLYVSHTRKREWPRAAQTGAGTPKNNIHLKKIMLSVWRGIRGMIYWKLLPAAWAITADLCFLHASAGPHIAKSIGQKFIEARIGYDSTSILFLRLGSHGIPLLLSCLT